MSREKINKILEKMDEVLLGKPLATRLALACLLARGHLLLEDLPGMGKTTLASSIASLIGLEYSRVQFTSDMLPADLIGVQTFDAATQEFSFRKGPVFTQLLLADEINRGSSRTQSALLEAMAEYQVSVDRQCYELKRPFFVIATQNPQDQSGTFVLPESELDRFAMRVEIGYPSPEAERRMLLGEGGNTDLSPIMSVSELLEAQEEVAAIKISDTSLSYLLALVDATRVPGKVPNPLSPRASKALLACSRAWAYIKGRAMVTADDIQAVFPHVAEHRMRRGAATVGSANGLSRSVIASVDPIM